jgi:hypothetical protein
MDAPVAGAARGAALTPEARVLLLRICIVRIVY